MQQKTITMIDSNSETLLLIDMGLGSGGDQIIAVDNVKVYRCSRDVIDALKYAQQQSARLESCQSDIDGALEEASDSISTLEEASSDAEARVTSAAEDISDHADIIAAGRPCYAELKKLGDALDVSCQEADEHLENLRANGDIKD